VTTSGATTLEKGLNTLRQWQSFDRVALATSASAIAISLLLGRGRLAALAPLVAIIIPTVVLRIAGAEVTTVESASGPIAVGLPPITLPDPGLISPTLVSTAAALAIVVLVQAAGVGAAYPNAGGPPNNVSRDFYAQGGANAASGLLGGIPVGGSVGQTAFNVMAGGTTRWAVILSGVWMLVFVVALGPALSAVPIPALAGLLILAGFQSLRFAALARTWRTSLASGAAALITMVATLVVPIHVAVMIGVLLTLLLVGITSANAVEVGALVPVGPGRWRRAPVPAQLDAGEVCVLDVEGAVAYASVPRLIERLPVPAPGAQPGQRLAVVIRLHGHLDTNLTFITAVEKYAGEVGAAGGVVFLCGLQSDVVEDLRSAGLPESIALVEQGEELDGSLQEAYDRGLAWVVGAAEAADPD
jgi:SulP family sulfate permease